MCLIPTNFQELEKLGELKHDKDGFESYLKSGLGPIRDKIE
jgi:hypothetical protein